MIAQHFFRSAILVLTLGFASAFAAPAFAETNATAGAASAHGVSANLLLNPPVGPDVTGAVGPLPAVSGNAPPDFNLSQTAAGASLNLDSLGNVLSTGVLTVTASSALASNQTNASATTNGLTVTVDPAGAPPPVVALNATEVRATATAQCVGGNVTVSGTTTLVGAQLSVLNGVPVSLASNPPPNTVVPIVGLAGLSIILNEQIVTANQITVNAIHIRFLNLPVGADLLTGDIIVSQAVASLADCVVAGASANLSVVKSGAASAPAGGQFTYQLVVTNNGPDAANGAVLQDPAVANFTAQSIACVTPTGGAVCPASPTIAQLQGAGITLPTLPAGSTLTFQITGTVGASGSISNTATIATPPGVNDPDPNNNSDTETTPITPAGGGSANLSIVKTGPASVAPNDQLTYQIVINNSGPNAANGAVFQDPAVANFTVQSVTCTGATGGAVCPAAPTVAQMQGAGITIPTLPAGGTVTFSINGTSGASGSISNTATIAVPPGMTDPDPTNNNDTETTPITPAGGGSANLSIVKTGPASVAANGQLTYQIVITNSGPNAANGAVFQDPAVANFTVQSVTCTGATGGAVCPAAPTVAQMQGAGITIPTLPAGGTVTFNINGTSGASGSISNTATIAVPPGMTDPDPNNNSDTETTPITPAGGGTADLSILKTAQGSATAGGQMSYQILITNNGPSAANGAVFRDPAVANFTATGVSCTGATGGAVCPTAPTVAQMQGSGIVLPTLPSGSSLTFLLTGTVGQSGTITNVAFITVPPGTVDPTPGNDSDPEVTPISVSGVGTAISVPALDRFGLALMVLLFAAVGWRVMHRQDG